MKPTNWKILLENILNDNKDKTKNIFNVSVGTIENNRPRVRTMVHRGFAKDSNYLLTTTDIRMDKVKQFENTYVDDLGSPVEYVFWIETALRQFRISANAFLLPSPKYTSPTPFSEKLKNCGIDFENERVRIYNEMSSALRSSFAKPFAPGSIRHANQDTSSYPSEVDINYDDKWYKLGLDHFVLVVLDPIQIDYVDLETLPNIRRIYKRVEDVDDKWSEEDVHP